MLHVNNTLRLNLHILSTNSSNRIRIIIEAGSRAAALVLVEALVADFFEFRTFAHVAVLMGGTVGGLGAFAVVAH